MLFDINTITILTSFWDFSTEQIHHLHQKRRNQPALEKNKISEYKDHQWTEPVAFCLYFFLFLFFFIWEKDT